MAWKLNYWGLQEFWCLAKESKCSQKIKNSSAAQRASQRKGDRRCSAAKRGSADCSSYNRQEADQHEQRHPSLRLEQANSIRLLSVAGRRETNHPKFRESLALRRCAPCVKWTSNMLPNNFPYLQTGLYSLLTLQTKDQKS